MTRPSPSLPSASSCLSQTGLRLRFALPHSVAMTVQVPAAYPHAATATVTELRCNNSPSPVRSAMKRKKGSGGARIETSTYLSFRSLLLASWLVIGRARSVFPEARCTNRRRCRTLTVAHSGRRPLSATRLTQNTAHPICLADVLAFFFTSPRVTLRHCFTRHPPFTDNSRKATRHLT